MATMKKTAPKAQLGGLIKKGIKSAEKITIPEGLKKSLKKSQSGPAKLKTVGSSEAERIAFGKKTNLQENPYNKTNYEKTTFIERDVKKSKPKRDQYGFDERPDRNGGTHKKAQLGGLIKKAVKKASNEVIPVAEKNLTRTSPAYNKKGLNMAIERRVNPEAAKKKMTPAQRRSFEVDDSYRKNGGAVKKKMKNGGSLSGFKASTKRVGPVDPKGAYTKVQKKTLAGAKGKATLTKDKQLGATKMAKTGAKMSKGKKC